MSDNTKNPNPRNLDDYEEGLDDDFDVPTYRRIADDGPAADVAPETPETPETLDGTGAGPMAGGAAGADETVAATTSPADAPLDDAHVDSAAAAPRDDLREADARDDAGETQVIPRRDIYAAAGRTAPQKIEPLAKADDYREADADFAADVDQPTQIAPAATGYDDDVFGSPGATAASASTGTAATVGAVGAVGAAGLGAGAAGADDYDRRRHDDALLDDGTYADGTTAVPVVGAADSDDRDFRGDEHELDRDLDPRRGTLDLGLLLLRLGVGGMLLMLGLATFFQFGGAPGIGALEAQFADNGYAFAGIIAVAIPTIQVIAGGLLVLGLATPLGAALALAISAFLTMFEVAVGDSGWNVLAAGAEPVRLQLMVTAAALALQFTGPGRYGIDFSRGWARRPLASSWIFCLLAIAAAVGLWYLTAGQLPFVNTTTGATA